MSYQSGDVQQYSAVQQSESFDAESGFGRRTSSSESFSSGAGATKKVVGVFVAVVLVACVFVAALANLYSTPAVVSAGAGAGVELAKEADAKGGKGKGKEPLIVEAHNTEVCDDPNYSSETLKLAHEMSVVALLAKPEAADPGPVFETSCILNIGDWFYAVSDDSPSIAKIRTRLAYNDPLNKLIPPSKPLVDGPQTELGFEALFWDEKTNVFTAVIEAVPLEGEPNKFHSMLYDFKIRDDDSAYDVSGACPADFEFVSGNKGFEGAALVRNSKGDQYVLGLCEGNFCEGGKRGRTPGNGRVVLLKRASNLKIHGKEYACGWAQQQVIELPKSIAFRDYSAITLYGSDPTHLRVAIASQENSAVWVGFLNADTWEFSESEARLFDFPRDGDCEVVYCNVEGLDFLNDNLLVAASDQMKNAGRQNSRCLAKDQSVHVFVIPPVPEAAEEAEEAKPKATEKEENAKAKGKGKAKKGEVAVAEVEGEELKAAKEDAAEKAAAKQEKEQKEAAKKQENEEKEEKKKAEKAEEKQEKEAKAEKKAEEEKEEKEEAKEKKAEKKAKEEAEEKADAEAEAQEKAERKAKREAKRAAEKAKAAKKKSAEADD